jgi:hypothetical protein
MKAFLKSIPFLCATSLLCFTRAEADTLDQGSVEQRDIQAIRDWINTKRQVTVKEKGGALSISGEVRSEMQAAWETVNGVSQRGARTPFDIPHETFDVEVNLMFDYRTDRTWASVKLEFDNDAGIFNGTLNKLKLERAYFGVRMGEWPTFTADVEIGRRRINSFVDSKIEGDSFFDGILFRLDKSSERFGNFYVHPGVFLINEKDYQYGYLGEVGLLNICNTGLYAKYLLIDWDTKDFRNKVKEQRFEFLTSQFLLGYKFVPKKWQRLTVVYLAALCNHAAHRLDITDHKLANLAGYAGFTIGELKQKGDFSLDVNYQAVQAQAVPDFDSSGLGLGNAAGAGFYTAKVNGTGGPTTRKTAAGNGNFRGYNITLEYLLTNNLILFQSWVQTRTLDTDIGPRRRYQQYEMEFNYAF